MKRIQPLSSRLERYNCPDWEEEREEWALDPAQTQ